MATRLSISVALLIVVAVAAAAGADQAWVLTGDYSQFGRLRSFDQAPPWTVSGDLAVTPGDAVGREHDGLLYVVGRGGASVLQIYDPTAGLALVREFSLGVGRNPQDIAFDTQGRAFVSCYDQAVLLRVDVNAGIVAQTYSTAAFADADGLPETAWMLARGDRLFIACQRLNRPGGYVRRVPAPCSCSTWRQASGWMRIRPWPACSPSRWPAAIPTRASKRSAWTGRSGCALAASANTGCSMAASIRSIHWR